MELRAEEGSNGEESSLRGSALAWGELMATDVEDDI